MTALHNHIVGQIKSVTAIDHGNYKHRNMRWHGTIKTALGKRDFECRFPVEKNDRVVFGNFKETTVIRPSVTYNHSQDQFQLYGSPIGITYAIMGMVLLISLFVLVIYALMSVSIVLTAIVTIVGGLGLGFVAVRLEHAESWYWLTPSLRALRRKLVKIGENG